jgi:hypothetical protein
MSEKSLAPEMFEKRWSALLPDWMLNVGGGEE